MSELNGRRADARRGADAGDPSAFGGGRLTATFAWLGAATLATGVVVWLAWRHAGPPRFCPEGMVQLGWRCCGEGQSLAGGRCVGIPRRCASDQDALPDGCLPTRRMAKWPTGCEVLRTPVDWDGAMAPIRTGPFGLDSHERTEDNWGSCVLHGRCPTAPLRGEPGLPQTAVSAAEAGQYCSHAGGRLPTVQELACAAMGSEGRRYPWGDAGAVCRRVAYGLSDGPCARGADGPQLAGTHPDGSAPAGDARNRAYDLAGNVAEWATDGDDFVVVGGSWRDASVSALRSFSARRVAPETRDTAIGFRCAFAAWRL